MEFQEIIQQNGDKVKHTGKSCGLTELSGILKLKTDSAGSLTGMTKYAIVVQSNTFGATIKQNTTPRPVDRPEYKESMAKWCRKKLYIREA